MSLKPVILELDDYAANVGEYFEKKLPGVVERKGTGEYDYLLRSPGDILEEDVRDIIKATLPQGKNLTMYGHGQYHHFTYGICAEVADRQSNAYTYVHIDNHHDTYWEHIDHFNCGSFVRRILDKTNAKSVRYIGTAPPEECVDVALDGSRLEKGTIKSVPTSDVAESSRPLDALFDGTPDDVYLTIDLDVMPQRYVTTSAGQSWGVGTMDTKTLMSAVEFIKGKKNIIGADILGYTGGRNGKGLDVYAQLAGRLVGKEIELRAV